MKKSFSIALIFFLFLGAYEIKAQQLSAMDQRRVNEAFKNDKVVYFKFAVTTMQEAASVSKIISIDRNQGKMIFAHADKEAFSKFIVKGYPYTVIKNTKPVAKLKPKVKAKKVKK